MSESFLGIITTAILAQAGDSGAATNPHDQQRKWNEYYSDQATKYEIRNTNSAGKLLELKPNPILFWSNPVRIGETNGAVFIWTEEGERPPSEPSSPSWTGATGTCGSSPTLFTRYRPGR